MIQPIFELILFAVAVIVCFYLPGKLLSILLKLKLHFLEDLFLSTVVGMMLFTLVAYTLSWLKLEALILPFIILTSLFVIKKRQWVFRRPPLLVLCMASIFSLSMVTAGVYGDSIFYRQGDDIWHLALINELKAHFPPDNPGFSYVPLRGYHYFSDFLLAKLSNIFGLSSLSLYFHFFPMLIAILWGIGVYVLMYRWAQSIKTSLWAVFLTMFGGSFAFILPLQGHNGLSVDSAFGISQAAPSLLNAPYAISIVIIIAALFTLHNYLKTREKRWLLPLILCAGIVTMFKVYAGMILLGGLLFVAAIEFMKRRFLFVFGLFAIGMLFLSTYWVLADRSAKLIFFPLWAPHKVLEDNLTWYGYTEKQYTYSRLSVIRGLIEIEVYALWVFIVGNLGSRMIGLFFSLVTFLKKRTSFAFFDTSVFVMMLIAILTPLFFIQSGRVFEIIQMAWYFLFFASLFAAIGFGFLFQSLRNRLVKLLLFILVVAITLPSTYENIAGYITSIWLPRSKLSDPYFQAMEFLRSQENYDATVLELPSRDIGPSEDAISYWYRVGNPAIVAFGNKRSFLSSQFSAFPNTDPKERIRFIRDILAFEQEEKTELGDSIGKELVKNKIVFLVSSYPLRFIETIPNIKRVYQNEGVFIYRFEK